MRYLTAAALILALLAGCDDDVTVQPAAAPTTAAATTATASPQPTAFDRTADLRAALQKTTAAGFAFTFGPASGVYDARSGGARMTMGQDELTVIGTDVWARVEPNVWLHLSVLKFAPGQNQLSVAFPMALLAYLAVLPKCVSPAAAAASCSAELDLTAIAPLVPAGPKKLAEVLATMLPSAEAAGHVPVTVTFAAGGGLGAVTVTMAVDAGPSQGTLTVTGPSTAAVAKPTGRIVEAPMDAY
ncbi:hypothetical protein [Dactylosporangium sp. CA-139066]|uniref:hypothetical protein n=1 Tax=Dactylosporangium sp. CA-139066 TaxID=3239930 RepID=UPI003D925CD8